MIESGLVGLIQADAAVLDLAPVGGFAGQVPEGHALPTWSYSVISEVEEYVLTGPDGLLPMRVQIDCYGKSAAAAQSLARAVHNVLNGYQGTLADADNTRVAGIFRENKLDFFDSASRTWRRMLEYLVWHYQQ